MEAAPVAAAQDSCLDALWTLLKEVSTLLEEAPAAAAHTLAAILALWQVGACLLLSTTSSHPSRALQWMFQRSLLCVDLESERE